MGLKFKIGNYYHTDVMQKHTLHISSAYKPLQTFN